MSTASVLVPIAGLLAANLNLAQVSPGMQLVVVLKPPLADVIAVVHVRNHDVSDARIACACAWRIVCPTPQTTNTTPEVPATYHCPFTCITSSMCTSSGIPFLKRIAACFDTERNVASSSNGNGETTTRTPIWKPLFTFSFGFAPAARSARNCPIGVVMPSCWMLMVG